MSTLLDRYAVQVQSGLRIKHQHDPIVHCVLGLAGEAGEVADLHKKAQYQGQDSVDAARVREELGDVLWYLQALATQYHTTLEELAKSNVAKLAMRRGMPYSLARLLGVSEPSAL